MLFNTILAIVKISLILLIMLLYALHSLCAGFFIHSLMNCRLYRSRLIGIYSRFGLKVLNIQLDSNKTFDHEGILFVGNHLSYLDILILSSIYPSCFVTSLEMKKTPVLGQMCELGGCLYVDRRSRNNLQNEIYDITNALKNNLNVTIFPEATSTNGESVLRFKRPLYNSALFANTSIVPFCLNYTSVNAAPVCKEKRDSLFWYGDMSFLPHLWRVCKLTECTVTISFLKEFATHKNEYTDQSLAEQTHSLVSQNFVPITT